MKLLNQLVLFSTLTSGQELFDQNNEALAAELEALYEDIEGLDPRGRGKKEGTIRVLMASLARTPSRSGWPEARRSTVYQRSTLHAGSLAWRARGRAEMCLRGAHPPPGT